MRHTTGRAGFLMGCLMLCVVAVRSQGLYPVSLDEKVSQSALIVEGKVVSKKSFWNSTHTMIYTSNEVEVYKVFKGSLQKKSINIITVGGTVGDHCIIASHLLELEKNQVGVFFCEQNPKLTASFPSSSPVFRVYSSMQGFLRYNLPARSASAPFATYGNIEKSLYLLLKQKTGRTFEIKNNRFSIESALPKVHSDNSTAAPVITSFSPATVNAGALLDPTNNQLTINGSGFGPASGAAAVIFSDADASPGSQFVEIAHDSNLVVSWSNTKIVVKVPTKAGSGTLKVRDFNGNETSAPNNLDVRFSVLTANFDPPYGLKQFNLGNMNGTGGYSIKYSISTANNGVNINASPAKATFQRALNTWKEGVGANLIEAGNSSMQVVNVDDGQNLVMYDNGGTTLDGPLAAGVLATCFSGITICSNSPSANQARKNGFDIVIRNTGYSLGTTPFTLGPCPPYSEASNFVDLESVLLHELGHALNLGHIVDGAQGSNPTINPSKVMHFSVAYNLRRISLDYSAKAGGEFEVTPHSYNYGNCVVGAAEMTPLATLLDPKDDCPASFPTNTTPMFTTVNFDLAHATSNKLVDPAWNQVTADGSSTTITNNVYYAFRTGATTGDLSLEVLNYQTNPAEIQNCTIGSAGIDVTGVKISLYKVASCPAAGAFPTPVAYRTFKTNGVIPVISNLSANTSYLLVADGIQNTKAIFDLVFSGSALPVLSTDLTGEVVGNTNHLTWTTDPDFGVTTMILERSADNIEFTQLEEIPAEQQEQGEYSDKAPLPGINYYRLRVENESGVIQYSKVISLNGKQGFSLKVYPNPASSWLYLEVVTEDLGKYGVTLHNAYGQKVYQKQFNVASRKHVEPIYVGGFKGGMYFITTIGKDGKRIRAGAVKVQ
jgi:hypothetical protein